MKSNKKLLIGLLILVIVSGLGYLTYSYGIKKAGISEVPYGDEFAQTDEGYQEAMRNVEDSGPSGEDSPWLTYSSEVHGFAFDYPVTVFVEVTDGVKLPLVYMDKELIIIPDGYGGYLTPVEIRTAPLIGEETVAERVANLKGSFDQETYEEKELPRHLTGVWMSGMCEGFGCGGDQMENIVLEGPNGLVSIAYLPGGKFEEDLFGRILATFRFD